MIEDFDVYRCRVAWMYKSPGQEKVSVTCLQCSDRVQCRTLWDLRIDSIREEKPQSGLRGP